MVNIIFQNQSLEIHQLKEQIYQCIREIGSLFIKSELVPRDISEFKEDDWKDLNDAKDKFLSPSDFLSTLCIDLDSKLGELKNLTLSKQKDFADIFQPYLCKIFQLLLHYLPYNNDLVKALDFVTLNASLNDLKQKVLYFNSFFGYIVPEDQISSLVNELNRLVYDENMIWMKTTSKKSSLHLWDLIKSTNEEFKHLSRIFQIAHCLPTSSAGVEQSFSLLKFIRSVLRSHLNEETTQSLLLISQAFNFEKFHISEKMLSLYDEMQVILSERKKNVSIPITLSNNFSEFREMEENKFEENKSYKRKSIINIERSNLKLQKNQTNNLQESLFSDDNNFSFEVEDQDDELNDEECLFSYESDDNLFN